MNVAREKHFLLLDLLVRFKLACLGGLALLYRELLEG